MTCFRPAHELRKDRVGPEVPATKAAVLLRARAEDAKLQPPDALGNPVVPLWDSQALRNRLENF